MDKSPDFIVVRLAAAVTVLSLCTWPTACASTPTHVTEADGATESDQGTAGSAAADAGRAMMPDGDAPTYAELYDTYFAKGTPGHCAMAGCHADPGHNVWLCGNDAETCYKGMTDMGLINPDHPEKSTIGDPKRSEITWINPTGGRMPLDAQGANDEAKAAIEAWLAAGAPRE
jgi:hypothetical protein